MSIVSLEVSSLGHEVGLNFPVGLPRALGFYDTTRLAPGVLPAFLLITEQEASQLKDRLLSFGLVPILLPLCPRDRQFECFLPVRFSQPKYS